MPTDIESASTDPVEKVKLYNYVLSCHPKGNSMGITDDQSNTHLRPSDVVSCQAAEGPAYMGRLRGLTFNGTRIDRAIGFNKPGSAGQQSIQSLIAEAGTTNGGGAGGQLGNYIGDTSSLSVEWSTDTTTVADTGNPPHDTKMSKGGKGSFNHKDINTSPFRNIKGQRMYARTPTTAEERGFDLRKRGSNLLIRTFLEALSAKLPFKILVNSTFRTKKRQGELVTIKMFQDTKAWSGITIYGSRRLKKFKKMYTDCGGDRSCVEKKQITYWEGIPAKGHGLGLSIDINAAGSLTRGQVAQVLTAAAAMGASAIMETTPPHIHITICKPNDCKDPEDSTIVQTFVEKWK